MSNDIGGLGLIQIAQADKALPEEHASRVRAERTLRLIRLMMASNPATAIVSGLMLSTKAYVVGDAVLETAATDGLGTAFNHNFLNKCSDVSPKCAAYLVLHELMHVALHHMTQPKELMENPNWNWAADMVINCQITYEIDPEGKMFSMDFEKIGGVKPDPAFRGMSVMQVLLQIARTPGIIAPPGKRGTFDVHLRQPADRVPVVKRKVQSLVRLAAASAAMRNRIGGGGMPGSERGSGQELMIEAAAPKVPWDKLLATALQSALAPGLSHSTWTRLNHKMASVGMMMPKTLASFSGGLLIQVDVSGSALFALSQFFADTQNVVRQVKPKFVTVLWTTTSVIKVQHFRPEDYATLGEKLKPEGNGGTDMGAGFIWLRDKGTRPPELQKLKYGAIITATDGETGYPDPKDVLVGESRIPAYWIIPESHRRAPDHCFTPPFGTTFYVEGV